MPNGKKLKLFLIVYFCCHPPLGGCGLKYSYAPFLLLFPSCHPPLGGCGLKCVAFLKIAVKNMSPSTRRVWIEITIIYKGFLRPFVTLHSEGVD